MMLKIKSVCSLQEKTGIPRELRNLHLFGGRILKERSSQRIKNMKSDQFEPTKFLTTCNKCLKVFTNNKGLSIHRKTCRLRYSRVMRNSFEPDEIIDLEEDSVPEDLNEYQNENFVRRSVRKIPSKIETQAREIESVRLVDNEEPLFLPNPFNEGTKMLGLRENKRGIKKRKKKRLRFTTVKAKTLALRKQMKTILEQEKTLEKEKQIYYKILNRGRQQILKSTTSSLIEEDSLESYDDLRVSLEPINKINYETPVEEIKKKKRAYNRKPVMNLGFSKNEQTMDKFPKKRKTLKESDTIYPVINPVTKSNIFFTNPKINKSPQVINSMKIPPKLPKKKVTFADTVVEHLETPKKRGRKKKVLAPDIEIVPISKIKSNLKKEAKPDFPLKKRGRKIAQKVDPVVNVILDGSQVNTDLNIENKIESINSAELNQIPQPIEVKPRKRKRRTPKIKLVEPKEVPNKQVPARLNKRRHSVENVSTIVHYPHLLNENKYYSDSEISNPHSKIIQKFSLEQNTQTKKIPKKRKKKSFKFTVHKKKTANLNPLRPKRKYVRKKKAIPSPAIDLTEEALNRNSNPEETINNLNNEREIMESSEAPKLTNVSELKESTTLTDISVDATNIPGQDIQENVKNIDKEVVPNIVHENVNSVIEEKCADSNLIQNIEKSNPVDISHKEDIDISYVEIDNTISQDSTKKSENGINNLEKTGEKIFDNPNQKTVEGQVGSISNDK